MRICIATMHPRLLSGQVESVTNLARGLRERGHDVRLFTIHHTDLLTVDHEVLPDPATGILTKIRRLWQLLQQMIECAEGVDLIYFSLPTPSFSFLGAYLFLRTGVPVVVGCEAHLIDCEPCLLPAPYGGVSSLSWSCGDLYRSFYPRQGG